MDHYDSRTEDISPKMATNLIYSVKNIDCNNLVIETLNSTEFTDINNYLVKILIQIAQDNNNFELAKTLEEKYL